MVLDLVVNMEARSVNLRDWFTAQENGDLSEWELLMKHGESQHRAESTFDVSKLEDLLPAAVAILHEEFVK